MQCILSVATLSIDWGLEDPTGEKDDVFLEVIHSIEEKVCELKRRIDNGLL